MSTPRKQALWSKSPKQVAADYLDGEYESMTLQQVAETERLILTSLINAVKREREKRARELVAV